MSAARSNGTYFSAEYQRIASRGGPVKALVAVEHAMLTTGELNRDPGADYFTRRAPAKTKARAIGQLESPGYKVTIEALTATGYCRTQPTCPVAPATIAEHCGASLIFISEGFEPAPE
jgi:hypothetical protein